MVMIFAPLPLQLTSAQRAGSGGGAPTLTLCLPCPSHLRFQSPGRACLWVTRAPVMPTAALARMIPVIELLVIMTAYLVFTPMRVAVLEISPVSRMGVIPPFPSWTIPVAGSDDIGFRIGVIRAPSIFWAKEVIQDAIQEPITVVIDPRGIGANPRRRYDMHRRGRIDLRLGKPRHRPHRAGAQGNCQD